MYVHAGLVSRGVDILGRAGITQWGVCVKKGGEELLEAVLMK